MQAIFYHDDAMGQALADRFLTMPTQWLCVNLALHDSARKASTPLATAPWLVLRVVDETRAALLSSRLHGLSLSGVTVIDMSPGSIDAARIVQSRVESAGGQYVDALCTGGLGAARTGSLNLLVGSAPAWFEALRPLFETIASQVSLVGAPGAGHVARMANQMLVGMGIAAVAETLHFAEAQGADPEKVRQALLLGGAASNVLKVHGQRMLGSAPVVNYPMTAHLRDLQLVLRSAQGAGTPLPQTEASKRLFRQGAALGLGDLDHSAVYRVGKPHTPLPPL